jgi:uncharacterized OB-fold protein
MADWVNEVETLTLKGGIKMPYKWSVGERGSRFLVTLRDSGKLVGNRCSECDTVFVPPRKNCGMCFKEIGEDNWVELGNEGVVTSHTIVRYDHPLQPVKAPFAYALIRLDGADVGFLHIVKGDPEKVKTGVRVRAKLKESREGNIMDIEFFEIVSS